MKKGYNVSGRKMEIDKISAKGEKAIGVDVERATITEDIVIKDVEVDARKDKGDAKKDPLNWDQTIYLSLFPVSLM